MITPPFLFNHTVSFSIFVQKIMKASRFGIKRKSNIFIEASNQMFLQREYGTYLCPVKDLFGLQTLHNLHYD
ncbi:TPA: hypothetical protein TU275_000707 [Streptococcus equi subsp. equi]|nr:hypothetical protein [Streptococcus equi subsp. equi]HEK9724871.1 hypothetical protein [Streptococcus equi subsp. equi]HEK9976382.1 hypothetical protein [Streptococcus equi subsp. equi]HEL0831815.1 hypothetical protein [Streptococcus equi subsp. equi]HEL0957853.1 hypothetical protein [Streptococcus equi subsp. equi]